MTFNDLDVAIELIAELTRKYLLLITGASMLSLTPYDQTNAVAVFTFPWISDEYPVHFDSALV